MWRALGTASPAVREKPFVRHGGTFVRFTRRFALQGGDCVIVFPRGRRVEVGPVALIRRCWPPSPAVREKRFGAFAVGLTGSPTGVEKVWMFSRVIGLWNSARSPSS